MIFSSLLQSYSEVIHGFTTRAQGPFLAGHSLQGWPENRPLVSLKQIHSGVVHVLGDPALFSTETEGDALVTQNAHVLVGIRTADCVPLLVYDPVNRRVAAIHAGWRGFVAGIIENTLAVFYAQGSNPKDLLVSIGMALCEACFEVGPEVREFFKTKMGPDFNMRQGRQDRFHLDLKGACQILLKREGVCFVENLPYCTRCQPDLFYSYRGGCVTERMMSFIGIKSSVKK